MLYLRKILFPIAIIYWLVTYIRNLLYDWKIFKSTSYKIPIVAIGNLSVGGTGKTPHTEYLIKILQEKYKIGVLSRGYKRTTNGYILANENITPEELGDESYQIYSKFKNIKVAVCEDRRTGIKKLIEEENCDFILLDDAFQHRKVKANMYILLTAFDDLFSNDYILPFGNLREPVIGKKRANLVIVTKCPKGITYQQKQKVSNQLRVNVPLFFTSIAYDINIYSKQEVLPLEKIALQQKTIVVGIAKPNYFINAVKNPKDEVLIYDDHHHFSNDEIIELKSKNQLIITTEKDYMRLKDRDIKDLFYLPITVFFLDNEKEFIKLILDHKI